MTHVIGNQRRGVSQESLFFCSDLTGASPAPRKGRQAESMFPSLIIGSIRLGCVMLSAAGRRNVRVRTIGQVRLPHPSYKLHPRVVSDVAVLCSTWFRCILASYDMLYLQFTSSSLKASPVN